MNKTVGLLILTNVLLTSVAQILLKGGMGSAPVVRALADGFRWSTAAVIAGNPLVLTGLTMYFLSAVVWLVVLSRVQVSLAYPFIGAGFIVTMLLAWFIHGETLTSARVAGTLLIAVGVAVLARS
jgi:drug/metabolite transporter (DMT)-like permease